MDIKDIENMHKGSAAFIIGAGPSLLDLNLESLKDFVTITVNSGIEKLPGCDYFVSDDNAACNWTWFSDTAKNSNCKKFLYKKKLKNRSYFFNKEDIVWYDHVLSHSPNFDVSNSHGYKLTKDKGIIAARTSSGSALHIAWLMGCDPIILLGHDACYLDGKRYFWQSYPKDKQPKRNDLKKIGYVPNRPDFNDQKVDAHCLDFNNYWNKVVENNPELKDRVFNVSECSIIEAFDKLSFSEVMSIYGDRKKK